MGLHTATKYNVITWNDACGSCIGQDLEILSGRSGQIISGLDTTVVINSSLESGIQPPTKMQLYFPISIHTLIL